MIYIFTGNNDFQILEEIKRLKARFVEKFGEYNIFHIKDILGVTPNYLSEILLASGLFADKKLVIIEGYPYGADEKGNFEEYNTFFTQNLLRIPEDNIVVFVSRFPDKRIKIYKDIASVSEIKEFSFHDDDAIIRYVKSRYTESIQDGAIRTLMLYKAKNISKIVSEIDKLLLTRTCISEKDIREYIAPELEESIFLIVEHLLNKDYEKFLKNSRNLLYEINQYAFYNSLLGNIRNFAYMSLAKDMGLQAPRILDLGNRAFLANKTFKMKSQEIQSLYRDLIEIDSTMKSGKMIGSDDEDFIYELEKIFLKR